ncbi:YbaK/EbsC family protein [Micromonospora sp. MH99]|uniref:YbaK/EbsC family protein n=1 Tax=Micromonospora sp. MH99 TaxID=1945510 RepID=UPI001F176A5B|nr:YbaK/EbsC family protein [Micromonospora sp. MH99]
MHEELRLAPTGTDGTDGTTEQRLIALLDEGGADYRSLDHRPEGRTTEVSALRGHPAGQAAKCIVVRLKITKKESRYVLAVVPGDQRLNLDRLKEQYQARHAMFADAATAERLTGSPSGTIVPFTFGAALDLIVDPGLLEHEKIFFNAGSLERSVSLRTADYVRLAQPSVQAVAEPEPGVQRNGEPSL